MKYLFILAVLSGCAGQIPEAKIIADALAKVKMQTPCGMTLGAFVRLAKGDKTVVEAYAKKICP